MADNDESKGLGGWLILVGIGVTLAPIRMLITYIPAYKTLFEDGTWDALTTAGSQGFNPLFAAFLIGEISYNFIIVIASIYLIYLYFSKNYLFPKLYIAILTVSLLFIPLDAWIVTKLLPGESMFDPETIKEFGRTLISAIIWIPYMLISKRVKATFVEKIPDKEMQSTARSAG